MVSPTKNRLVAAAAALLDEGGQDAVTLRAVAERVGLSHNAPYKHFKDRNALLAGVARSDFESLTRSFEAARDAGSSGIAALRTALAAYIGYAAQHSARYRLLFSDTTLSPDSELSAAAGEPMKVFVEIVVRCQYESSLPNETPIRLAGLLYATAHGAIDLKIGGRSGDNKGLSSVQGVIDLALRLIKS